MKFASVVELGGKTATGIEVPAEVVEALGKGKRPPVSITVAGYTYRSTVAPMGGRSLVPLSAEHRSAAGVAAGDVVEVEVELDEAPRSVEVPDDLAAALTAAPAAEAAFARLSYSQQRAHVLAVTGAKKPETRQRRVQGIVTALTDPT